MSHLRLFLRFYISNDGTSAGKELRLKQQHFFVSASIQDMLRSLDKREIPVEEFPEHWQVQLNDTHPSVAVAELMRLLVDERHIEWDLAWEITTKSIAYTNHTLLPEALEKWDLQLFKTLLPRHTEIIYEINRRFLQVVRLKYLWMIICYLNYQLLEKKEINVFVWHILLL